MKTHDEMVREWMKDPALVREYDGLEQEFALFDELLRARKEAGPTQAEVAERMATQSLAPGAKSTEYQQNINQLEH